MNRFVKLMLMTSSIVAILGILLIVAGAITGADMGLRVRSSGIEIIEAQKVKDTNLNLEEFHSIDVDLSYADIIIEKGSDYGIELIYHESKYVPEYSISQGVLFVTDNSQGEGFYNYLNLDMTFGLEKSKVVIYLPYENLVEAYDINVDSGTTNITVSGSNMDYSIDAGTGIGIVKIDGRIKGFDYKDIVPEAEKTIAIQNNIGTANIFFE